MEKHTPIKVLFIPVSSAKGVGEYARSLNIADAISRQIENAEFAFIISEEAKYSNTCPYTTFKTPFSPTKCSKEVISIIEEVRPSIVFFVGSGRVSQLKYCKSRGIPTIYVSQHNNKRKKGLRVRRLRYLDSIWDVQPPFSRKPLSGWERFKVKMLDKNIPLALDPISATFSEEFQQSLLENHNLERSEYILVNAGGGGQQVDGVSAPENFSQAALGLVREIPYKMVIVYGPNFTGSKLDQGSDNILELSNIDSKKLNALLKGARAAILGGGDTLLQALRYNVPSVAVSLAHDQEKRIQSCVNYGGVIRSDFAKNDIQNNFLILLDQKNDPPPRFNDQTNLMVNDILRLTDKSLTE